MKDTKQSDTKEKPTYSTVYHVDGRLRLSLRTVLDILGLRVIYSKTKLRFIDLETNKERFQFPRHPDGIRTPWDALRKRKMLDRDKFEHRAIAFLEANPRYTA